MDLEVLSKRGYARQGMLSLDWSGREADLEQLFNMEHMGMHFPSTEGDT